MAFKAPGTLGASVSHSALHKTFRTNQSGTVYTGQFGFRMVASGRHVLLLETKMTQLKSGYSSNIIAAIAVVIILLGILDTVKFWAPLLGVRDMEALAKEFDPMKPVSLQVQQEVMQESPKEKP